MSEKLWRDPETLKRLYWDEGLSQEQVAERLGCEQSTVHRWLHKLDLGTRQQRNEKPPQVRMHQGYEVVVVQKDGERHYVGVHRLVALLDHDPHDVFSGHVHHENDIPWDNRPDNIEVLPRSEHLSHHAQEKPRAEDGTFVS